MLEHIQHQEQPLDDNCLQQNPQHQHDHHRQQQQQQQNYLNFNSHDPIISPAIVPHLLTSLPKYPLPHPVEGYYAEPPPTDFVDFGTISMDHEDFDTTSEILTRPRLTKEQVEVLEAQFQAHPKPNSNIKRQLAVQTSLTLPRVAVSARHPYPPTAAC